MLSGEAIHFRRLYFSMFSSVGESWVGVMRADNSWCVASAEAQTQPKNRCHNTDSSLSIYTVFSVFAQTDEFHRNTRKLDCCSPFFFFRPSFFFLFFLFSCSFRACRRFLVSLPCSFQVHLPCRGHTYARTHTAARTHTHTIDLKQYICLGGGGGGMYTHTPHTRRTHAHCGTNAHTNTIDLKQYVTLPPEMSLTASWSLLGYSQFSKGGAILSSLVFQRNQFRQFFLHQKNTLMTYTKSV